MNYQDLIYFGYSHKNDSYELQQEFINEIKERFPNVKLIDCYSEFKGYRQEVYLDDELTDEYWVWLIAHGWFGLSLCGNLMMHDSEKREKIKLYIETAKNKYPKKFKK